MDDIRIVPVKKNHEQRYQVVDAVTGKVLDDAQGYGFKSVQKARACWLYKNRDKSKDAERAAKENLIMDWMEEHKDFVEGMDQIAFEKWKGSWGDDDEFDAGTVKDMLINAGYTDLPFSARDLYKIWGNGPTFAKKRR